MKFFSTIDLIIEKTCIGVLVLAVMLMLGFSCAVIVLRMFETSYLWIDPFLRHLVFFSAFLGGCLATGNGTHIGIDALSRMLESYNFKRTKYALSIVVYLVCFIISIALTKVSVDFVKMELEFGHEIFMGVTSGQAVMSIPLGFGLIAYRYFYLFLRAIVEPEKIIKNH